MIIAVDAAVLGVTDDRLKAGVYNLVLNLLENLSRIDKKNKYFLYSFDPIPTTILEKLGTNWTNLVLRPKRGWLTFRLSLELIINKVDVFLGLGQALPLFHPNRSIVYVYDLAFELFPQFYPDSHNRLARQTRFVGKNCEKIVAISNSTKNDLVRLYNINPEKIKVIHPGVRFVSSTPGESLRDVPYGTSLRNTPGVSLALSNSYFLFVGSYKPVKNIPNIIKAFKLFLQESKKPYQLILAGSDYWMDDKIVTTVKECKLEKLVKLAGFVSDKELGNLYREASVFVSPSHYEGFGIPLLEAMASGVPVITSDRGSIPEATGNAALTVSPADIKGLKDAMSKIVSDNKLREQLKIKGLNQAKKFTWEKSAKELLQIIKGMDPGSRPG